jgi:hypothetical protein
VDGGKLFAPEGVFPFRLWQRQASPLPEFFLQCLGLPMRTGSRGMAWPEMAAQLCRRSGEFFSLLPSVFIRGSFGDELGFTFFDLDRKDLQPKQML